MLILIRIRNEEILILKMWLYIGELICICGECFFQNDVQLMKEGDKVGASEATLLNMLNISPFTYGLVVLHVYDQGTVFSPKVLDITDEDLLKSFQTVGFYTFLYIVY